MLKETAITYKEVKTLGLSILFCSLFSDISNTYFSLRMREKVLQQIKL
jgi:hypothetical protein